MKEPHTTDTKGTTRRPVLFAVLLLVIGGGCFLIGFLSQSKIENRSGQGDSKIEAPAFSPSLHIVPRDDGKLGFAENPFGAPAAPEPWLVAKSSDATLPPGASPATTFFMSTVEPVIERGAPEHDGRTHHWKITFKP